MTVIDIICEYLEKHGYDGLYQPGECACLIGDLLVCNGSGYGVGQCKPGYTSDCIGAECECGGEYEESFHVGPEKVKP